MTTSSLVLLALAGAASANWLTAEYVEANEHSMWSFYKADHGKAYATAAEEAARKAIFKANMLKAAEAQARNPKATFGPTKFSDLAAHEVAGLTGGFQVPADLSGVKPQPYSGVLGAANGVPSKDWRSAGAVTAVKNQGMCGSCWTFGTTGATESHNFIHGDGKLTSLSEQYFVSCARGELQPGVPAGNACEGGLPMLAMYWAIVNHGGDVVTEASYPYTSALHINNTDVLVPMPGGKYALKAEPIDACAADVESKPVGARIADVIMLGNPQKPADEGAMAQFLAEQGPLAIGISAGANMQSVFQHYTGGVITTCVAAQPDHAVVIVGIVDGAWIIRNSWGNSWGEAGYFRVEFGSNQCNLVAFPAAPKMA